MQKNMAAPVRCANCNVEWVKGLRFNSLERKLHRMASGYTVKKAILEIGNFQISERDDLRVCSWCYGRLCSFRTAMEHVAAARAAFMEKMDGKSQLAWRLRPPRFPSSWTCTRSAIAMESVTITDQDNQARVNEDDKLLTRLTSCLFCSARVNSLEECATATEGQDCDYLARAWRSVFKLPNASMPSTSTSSLPLCGSCSQTQVMEELKTCWVQLNEVYSRIEELRRKTEDTLQTVVEKNANATDESQLSRRRFTSKLLEALRTSERYEVDHEALRLYNKDKDNDLNDDNLALAKEDLNLEFDEDIEMKVEAILSEFGEVQVQEQADREGNDGSGSGSEVLSRSQSQSPRNMDSEFSKVQEPGKRKGKGKNTKKKVKVNVKTKLGAASESEIKDDHLQTGTPLNEPPKSCKKFKKAALTPECPENTFSGGQPRKTRIRKKYPSTKALKHYPCRRMVDSSSSASRSRSICTFKFFTALQREAHELRFHEGDPRPYKCRMPGPGGKNECGRGFPHQSRLDDHVRLRHPGGSALVVVNVNVNTGRTSTPDSDFPFRCDLCNRGLYSEEALRTHKANVHGDSEAGQKPAVEHLCTICGKVVHHRTSINLHMRRHAASAPLDMEFKCKLCPESRNSRIFVHQRALRSHELREHRQAFAAAAASSAERRPKHRCRFCDKVSDFKATIKHHEVLKHGAPNTGLLLRQCSWPGCSYRTFKRFLFEAHEASHKNVRVHKCPVEGCGAAYNHKTSLLKHSLIHSGERPFKCPYENEGCDLAFRDSGHLQDHIKVVHEKDKPGLRCELCGKGFPIKTYLQRHLKKHAAGKIPPYQ